MTPVPLPVPAVSLWTVCPPPAPHLGEEAVVQHVPQAGPCRGLRGKQAGNEVPGMGREVRGQRVPHCPDAPVQLLPAGRLKRGAARQCRVPGGGPAAQWGREYPLPFFPPSRTPLTWRSPGPTRLRAPRVPCGPAPPGPGSRVSRRAPWGEGQGEPWPRSPPPGNATAPLTPSAGRPVPPAAPAPGPRSSPASSPSPRSCLWREMSWSGAGAAHIALPPPRFCPTHSA